MTYVDINESSPLPEPFLLAKLGYAYLSDWFFLRTISGEWIILDESRFLENAMEFPSDETLLIYLQDLTIEKLEKDPLEFLEVFFKDKALINREVADLIADKLLNDGYPPALD